MGWGKHAIVDASNCDLEAIKNIRLIEDFINELIEKSNMTKWGELFWMDLKETDNIGDKDFTEVAGISCCQFITTSNITCHFANNSKSMYLDFFSCKDFSEETVILLVNKYFKPKKIKIRCIDRDAL
ncbi:MAG TPA: S-adenosylmethionine decarboxylase [Allocoleopsis sp.]